MTPLDTLIRYGLPISVLPAVVEVMDEQGLSADDVCAILALAQIYPASTS